MTTELIIPEENAIERVSTSLVKEGWGSNVSPALRRVVARLAVLYGLDPLADELMLMGGSKPYVTVAGLRRTAQRGGQLDGVELEPYDRKNAAKGEAWWRCSVWLKGAAHPFTEFGRAGGPGERNPVARNHPEEMARTRALGRALRIATGVSLPLAEEMDQYQSGSVEATKPSNGDAHQDPAPVEDISAEEATRRGELAELLRCHWSEQRATRAAVLMELQNAGAGSVPVRDGKPDLLSIPSEILARVLNGSAPLPTEEIPL